MVVYKYELVIPYEPPGILGQVKLPYGAKILKIGCQTVWCVWCMVDPREIRVRDHKFLVVGTDHKYDKEILEQWDSYQETVISLDGKLVFHFWLEV